jgi:hypothetical protein
MTGRGSARLLCVAYAAALSLMPDALPLNSHGAFAQPAPASLPPVHAFAPTRPVSTSPLLLVG